MTEQVVAALIIRSGLLLLGLRSATRRLYPGVWDVFGGHMEPGEQHGQTLVRELEEELGITPTHWTYLETLHLPIPGEPDHSVAELQLHLYRVTQWTGTPLNRQTHEHETIQWFSLAQALQVKLAHPTYPALFAYALEQSRAG